MPTSALLGPQFVTNHAFQGLGIILLSFAAKSKLCQFTLESFKVRISVSCRPLNPSSIGETIEYVQVRSSMHNRLGVLVGVVRTILVPKEENTLQARAYRRSVRL